METTNPLVCIGGVGGSGTRIYAAFLSKLGIHLGRDLNDEKDDLLFTRLLKNPSWYASATDSDIQDRLSLFKKITTLGLLPEDKEAFSNIYNNNACFPTPPNYNSDILTRLPQQGDWGWKEPNSSFYLDHLTQAFPALKYILVIRNGLDMSMSMNRQQLINWGELLFGINADYETEIEKYTSQLDFWIAANQRAIELGTKNFNDNFYIANFETLCDKPDMEIRSIISFLGLHADNWLISELVAMVSPRNTVGRYKRDPYPVSQARLDSIASIYSHR